MKFVRRSLLPASRGPLLCCALAALVFFPSTQAMAQSSPTAVNDSAECWENDFVSMYGILYNDVSYYGFDIASVEIVSYPANGVVYVDPDYGEVNYVPDQEFVGWDSFSYRFRDYNGTLSNVATFTVYVKDTSPPAISTFNVSQIDCNMFWVSGTVVDGDVSTVTVHFGGALEGQSTAVDSSGNFGFSVLLYPEERGLVSAQAVNQYGILSEMAYNWVE